MRRGVAPTTSLRSLQGRLALGTPVNSAATARQPAVVLLASIRRLRCFSSGNPMAHGVAHERVGPARAAIAGASAVIGAVVVARFGSSWFVDSPDSRSAPPKDQSRATVILDTGACGPPEPMTQKRLRTQSQLPPKQRQLQEVDAKQFATFIAQQRAMVQRAQEQTRATASTVLHEQLTAAISGPRSRVRTFADWYFAYSTTYTLFGLAMTSAAKHVVTLRTERSLSAAVVAELQEHVCRKYQAIVMRPALTDPELHRAFVHSLQCAHKGYRDALRSLDEAAKQFVAEQSKVYASPPQMSDVVLSVDYSTHLHKIEHVPIEYEKSPEVTLALVGTGAAVGKAAGGIAVSGAVKALAAKVATPFATKAAAATLSGACAGGVAAGGLAAGPAGAAVGAAAGAMLGLGVDMTAGLALSLMQRPSFEADVHVALDGTLQAWEEKLLSELERVQHVWFDRALDTLVEE